MKDIASTWDEFVKMEEEKQMAKEEHSEKVKVTPKEYIKNGDNYFPMNVADKTNYLPPGAYTTRFTQEGMPYLSPMDITTDKIINIPDSVTEKVVAEIEQFWSEGVSKKFIEYGLVHKRGVILHGPPGTGKTVTLAQAAKLVINTLGGVVLFNPSADVLPLFLKLIKDIEPNKKVLVIWEEFDSMLRRDESELLSLLDGETQVGNIMYLATTNYITRIPARIKNRPSRFASIIEVNIPSAEARRAFLTAKLVSAEDREKYLEPMVEASDGFVMDQVKDLIISVCCFGYAISDAVLKIKEMREEGMGVDDAQEAETKDYFSLTKDKKVVNPLKPI